MNRILQCLIVACGSFIASGAWANCEAAKENLAGKFSWQGWQQQTMNKDCQNLKIQPEKPQVKILGGRPIIKNPEKHLGKSYDYCKDGRLHKVSIIPNQVFDTAIWTDEVLKKRAESYKMSVEEYKKSNLLQTEITRGQCRPRARGRTV